MACKLIKSGSEYALEALHAERPRSDPAWFKEAIVQTDWSLAAGCRLCSIRQFPVTFLPLAVVHAVLQCVIVRTIQGHIIAALQVHSEEKKRNGGLPASEQTTICCYPCNALSVTSFGGHAAY